MIDIVIGAYLLVPFNIGRVGGDVEFDESMLIEEDASCAGVGAEVGGNRGVFAAKY